MSRPLKVTGNHVEFVRFVMLPVIEGLEEAKHDFHFFFRSMYNKTVLIFDFCDIQNNQGLAVRVISLNSPSASADNPYLDLDYSGYYKNIIQ